MAMAMEMDSAPILPEEVIVEILSWLPVKSLKRFACVSKTWNSLILHPSFVKLHLERSSKNNQILLKVEFIYEGIRVKCCSVAQLIQNPTSCYDENIRWKEFPDFNLLIGSYNGLFCLHKYHDRDDDEEERCVYFWNPSTRIMSEPSPRLHLHSRDYLIGPMSIKCGFGYDDESDTYKVVELNMYAKPQQMMVRVYCTGDTCWRDILSCPSFFSFERAGESVSGTVNWIGFSSNEDQSGAAADVVKIFSYDLKNETYRYLPVPCGTENPVTYPRHPRLRVLNGCLAVSFDHQRTNFVVLLLKEIRGETSWTQILNISYESLQILVRPYTEVIIVGKYDDVMLLTSNEGTEWILYKLKDNRLDSTETFCRHFTMSYDYVPSLVLPP